MNEQSKREAELVAAQAWRNETPGHAGWKRTVRADDPNKLFVLFADSHAIEPKDWMDGYIDDDVREQLRIRRSRRDQEMDAERAEGVRELKDEGNRVTDNARDGVDAEIIFPGAVFLAVQIANDAPDVPMNIFSVTAAHAPQIALISL